ncbi:hypothetical protein, partial [Mesorhizobium sp. Cs1321R2N1]|uniref:hypothetical protein n=1 Tax=Mesorhizobium sp. Cs1321R2N1 TaxID=3015174 RepID=UPI00301E49CB
TLAAARTFEPPLAAGFFAWTDLFAWAGLAAALDALPGTTFFGGALPKAFVSLERWATGGPAPAVDCGAFGWTDLPLGFFALVAIGRNPSSGMIA